MRAVHRSVLFWVSMVLVLVGGALGLLSWLAPVIGLGSQENFLFYRLFGISRSDLASYGSVLAGVTLLVTLLVWGMRGVCYLRTHARSSAQKVFAGGIENAVLVLLTLCLCLAVAEGWMRFTVPFNAPISPLRYGPEFGVNYIPGAEVRATNNVDFWTISRANALGFLDREPPPAERRPGTCRVAFIGDSFVEAAQVPIEQKQHVLFEAMANQRFPDTRFETFALGYSGTGQSNQLQFYDAFAKSLRPDVVVLEFVSNDFANNSAVLEAIRNNWRPDTAPRLFFERNSAGRFQALPVAPLSATVHLAATDIAASGWGQRLADKVLNRSYVFRWLQLQLSVRFPNLGAEAARQKFMAVSAALRALPGYANALDGWNYPDDLDMDNMFFAESMPRVFDEAQAATGHALDEFRARAAADGFSLVAVAVPSLSSRFDGSNMVKGRRMVDKGYLRRLQALLEPRGIPLVDMGEAMERRNLTLSSVSWTRDGHFNPFGHRLAAENLLEFFAAHPGLCGHEGAHR